MIGQPASLKVKARKLPETFFEIKNKANLVRRIDLVSVLRRTGCVRDKYDRAK